MERVDRTVIREAFSSPNLNASERFGNQYICWIKYWNVRIDLGLNKSGCKKRGYCCHVGKSHCFNETGVTTPSIPAGWGSCTHV